MVPTLKWIVLQLFFQPSFNKIAIYFIKFLYKKNPEFFKRICVKLKAKYLSKFAQTQAIKTEN